MEVDSGVDDSCLILLDFDASKLLKLRQSVIQLLMWPLTAGQQQNLQQLV